MGGKSAKGRRDKGKREAKKPKKEAVIDVEYSIKENGL